MLITSTQHNWCRRCIYHLQAKSIYSGVDSNNEEPDLTTYYANSSYSNTNLPDGVNVFNQRADGSGRLNDDPNQPFINDFYEGYGEPQKSDR
ncbi:MAG: hypothetical protein U5M51_05855 [Emticicia sp.]|nr:hypothetical protein [Emticicia sp.]